MAKRAKFQRKKRQNKYSMLLVTMVVLMLVVVVAVSGAELKEKNRALDEKIAEYEKKVSEETDRAAEIEEFGKYTQTKKYKEEVAKEKLGLVYEDEILFQQND